MEGLVLMMLYLIIAVSFWYYPVSDPRFVLDAFLTPAGIQRGVLGARMQRGLIVIQHL